MTDPERWILYPGGSWHLIRRDAAPVFGTRCGKWIVAPAEIRDDLPSHLKGCETCKTLLLVERGL